MKWVYDGLNHSNECELTAYACDDHSLVFGLMAHCNLLVIDIVEWIFFYFSKFIETFCNKCLGFFYFYVNLVVAFENNSDRERNISFKCTFLHLWLMTSEIHHNKFEPNWF